MIPAEYSAYQGNVVNVQCAFVDPNDSVTTPLWTDPATGLKYHLVDPSVIKFVLLAPDGTTYIRSQFGDSVMVRLSQGLYQMAVSCDQADTIQSIYSGRWYSTGTAQASIPFTISVAPAGLV